MRWISFIILALGVIVLQTSLAPWIQVRGARPDWVFIIVVHLALTAPKTDALLGAWTLGLFADLNTDLPLGFLALVYGLSALTIVEMRGLLVREHLGASLGVTFVTALAGQSVIAAYRLLTVSETGFFDAGGHALLTALYTALFAPYLLRGLRRVNPLLGIEGRRGARYARL